MKNIDVLHDSVLPLCRAASPQREPTLEEIAQVAEKVERGGMMEARLSAIARSGLLESEVRDALGIAPNQWSQMKLPKTTPDGDPTPGRKHFSEDLHDRFEQLVGNDLVTRVIAFRRGLECRPMKSTLEQELEATRAQLELERQQNEAILSALAKLKAV